MAAKMENEAAIAVVSVDLRLYRLVAVQKAAHRYTGHYRIQMRQIDPERIDVAFFAKPGSTVLGRPSVLDFETDLLDQELREAVGTETLAIRNLILAQAFSNVNLLDPVGEQADFEADPLDIRTPEKRS
ncbi:MAG: His-Xaa-Ser system protein HxsD [Tepidisphaeraceae bacterium]